MLKQGADRLADFQRLVWRATPRRGTWAPSAPDLAGLIKDTVCFHSILTKLWVHCAGFQRLAWRLAPRRSTWVRSACRCRRRRRSPQQNSASRRRLRTRGQQPVPSSRCTLGLGLGLGFLHRMIAQCRFLDIQGRERWWFVKLRPARTVRTCHNGCPKFALLICRRRCTHHFRWAHGSQQHQRRWQLLPAAPQRCRRCTCDAWTGTTSCTGGRSQKSSLTRHRRRCESEYPEVSQQLKCLLQDSALLRHCCCARL